MDGPFDRISSLPDDVLTHILSFVSAKEVVQTCILSKRWRNIWASVPVLKFCFHASLEDNVDDGEDDSDDELHVLLKPKVISVRISLLDIEVLNVPDSVFSCQILQNLELSITTDWKTSIKSKSMTLPSLKTLKLGSLSLDNDFARNLFLGCPSLESLNLEDCDLLIPEISSNVLKKLTLEECWQFCHMQICCPSLVSLFIKSSMNSIRIISLVNMASLVNAEIDLCGDDEVVVDKLPNLCVLCGLSNVTSLKLILDLDVEIDLKEQWGKHIHKSSIFKNLKNLEIGSWDIIDDFNLVACLLEHSPVLQELTFNLFYCYIDDDQEEPRQHSFFQLEYLDMVKISCGKKENVASKLISLLGRHVKTIGNVIIT